MTRYFKGLFFALLIALIAVFLGRLAPLVGAPVFGILIGMAVGNLLGKPQGTAEGLRFASKNILQVSIVFLGAGLNLAQIFKVGIDSLYVMFFTITAAFVTSYGLGRLMKIPLKITSLIGMGTAICGGSAIAAISPIIEADEKDITYSISTVFCFNVIAVLVFPLLGHLLGFSDKAFGLWAGTAINDTSSVVAAGYSYSNAAGAYGTIVKLTRTTMIIPIALIFAAVMAVTKKNDAGAKGVNYRFQKTFPWFILYFLAASLINTAGIFGAGIPVYATETGKFLIVLALSAIGMNSDVKKMAATGLKPMLLGFLIWVSVALVSLAVQYLTGWI